MITAKNKPSAPIPPIYPREDAAQQMKEATAALRKLFPYMFLLSGSSNTERKRSG